MANASGGTRASKVMMRCYQQVRRHGLLVRNSDGYWQNEHHQPGDPRYRDRTVHALIVRGYFETTERHVTSRQPLAVRIADRRE